MPGGIQVIHEPWRMAVSYLRQTFGEFWQSHVPCSLLANFPAQKLRLVERLLRSSARLTQTSSCGRLFDAVAALTLGRMHVSYEAQDAIALEACCDSRDDAGAYPFGIYGDTSLRIETAPLFIALVEDLQHGVAAHIISSRFHSGLVHVLTEAVLRISQRTHLDTVCLSGGSFQNAYLSTGLEKRLAAAGLSVFTHTQVPPGDGGLSLGQLMVAAHRASAPSNMETAPATHA